MHKLENLRYQNNSAKIFGITEDLARWRDYTGAEIVFIANAESGVIENEVTSFGKVPGALHQEVLMAVSDCLGASPPDVNIPLAAEFLHLNSFIVRPVVVNGYVRNILCFINIPPGDERKLSGDIAFIEFCAGWISGKLTASTIPLKFDSEVLHEVLSATSDAVIVVDELQRITFLNRSAEILTRRGSSSSVGVDLSDVFQFAGEPNVLISDYILRALETDRTVGLSERNIMTNDSGVEIIIEGRVLPIKKSAKGAGHAAVIFRDVSDAQNLESKLSWSVIHDPLTGVFNRTEMERRVGKLLGGTVGKGRRRRNSLIHLGVDHFQVVNDTCGTVGGDTLLKNLADLIKTKIRSEDVVARVGADEFAILLEGCNIESASRVANNIKSGLAEIFSWAGKPVSVSVSIGLVAISHLSERVDEVFGQSSSALSMAKQRGRNRIWVHQADDVELAKRSYEMQWVAQIASAIELDRLILFHQKIIPVIEGHGIPHHEILLRMLDENDKLIPPMAFIPTAERFGLMYALDRWVLKESFRLMGVFEPNSIVAINVSAQSLCADDLLEYVTAITKKFSVVPSRICFEITETAAIANLERAKEFIVKAREMGFKFALDDFGVGFNSFANLKALVVDYLKIDGSFVKNLARDRVDYTMVEAINRVGRTMGVETIAEFVEDQVTIDILKLIGVNYAQGYHVHKPEPLVKKLF